MDCGLKEGVSPWVPNPMARFFDFDKFQEIRDNRSQVQVTPNNYTDYAFYEDQSFSLHNSYPALTKLNSSTLSRDAPYWALLTLLFIIARIAAERFIFLPLGKYIGIKDRARISHATDKFPKAGPFLETAFRALPKKTHLDKRKISELVTQTGMSCRQVERWFRWRRGIDRPSTLTKFSESCWRLCCYVMSTGLGLVTLWNKPWAWDTELCLKDTDTHEISTDMRIYVAYGFGLYGSFLMTQAFDVKRKDFLEMFLHHVITVTLMSISVKADLVRIGLYVLLLHDCADIFLEAAKLAIYAKRQLLSTGIFLVFTFVWIVTRLTIFPKTVVLKLMFHDFSANTRAYEYQYFASAFLTGLFGLHIFWTYFICKVAISAVTKGSEKHKDARSSSESSSDGEEEPESETDRPKPSVTQTKKFSVFKRYSLQIEDKSGILNALNTNQRKIMKRISTEIM